MGFTLTANATIDSMNDMIDLAQRQLLTALHNLGTLLREQIILSDEMLTQAKELVDDITADNNVALFNAAISQWDTTGLPDNLLDDYQHLCWLYTRYHEVTQTFVGLYNDIKDTDPDTIPDALWSPDQEWWYFRQGHIHELDVIRTEFAIDKHEAGRRTGVPDFTYILEKHEIRQRVDEHLSTMNDHLKTSLVKLNKSHEWDQLNEEHERLHLGMQNFYAELAEEARRYHAKIDGFPGPDSLIAALPHKAAFLRDEIISVRQTLIIFAGEVGRPTPETMVYATYKLAAIERVGGVVDELRAALTLNEHRNASAEEQTQIDFINNATVTLKRMINTLVERERELRARYESAPASALTVESNDEDWAIRHTAMSLLLESETDRFRFDEFIAKTCGQSETQFNFVIDYMNHSCADFIKMSPVLEPEIPRDPQMKQQFDELVMRASALSTLARHTAIEVSHDIPRYKFDYYNVRQEYDRFETGELGFRLSRGLTMFRQQDANA